MSDYYKKWYQRTKPARQRYGRYYYKHGAKGRILLTTFCEYCGTEIRTISTLKRFCSEKCKKDIKLK